MTWEALIWSGLAAVGPALAGRLWPRWRPGLGSAAEPLERLAPWLHGVGLAYLALIRGAILSWDAGLRGHDLTAWLAGGTVSLLLLAAVRALVRRSATLADWPDPLQAFRDEPRWALYRAAGALWSGSHALGTGIGLGWAVLEWALTHRRGLRGQAATLLRLAGSALVFLFTRNFWLTGLWGALLLALLGRAAWPGGYNQPEAVGGKG